MRNRGVGRLTFVLSATELCELVPDIPIMTDFRITPAIWVGSAVVRNRIKVSTNVHRRLAAERHQYAPHGKDARPDVN